MGNCCTGSCLLDAEIVLSRSRRSIARSTQCYRRAPLWLLESEDRGEVDDGDSTKVLMEVVPCDTTEDEKQFIVQVESTANGNLPSKILVDSLPPDSTEEADPLNALVDTRRTGDGHSVTVVALVHTDASFPDSEDQTQEAASDPHNDTSADENLGSSGSEDLELPEGWG